MGGFASGKKLGLGVPGGLTRQIDNVIVAEPNQGTDAIPFGAVVVRTTDGVKLWAANSTIAQVLGVALRIVKTNETYAAQDAKYVKFDTVDILTRGGVAVNVDLAGVSKTAPIPGAKVYIRSVDGCFVTEAEAGAALELTNAIWASAMDASNLAEITLLTRKA